jgi:diaminopimelate decarboxylase
MTGLPQTDTGARTWWIRPGLEVRDGRLLIAGRNAATLSREHGSPLYVYDVEHVREQIRAVRRALAATCLPYRVRLALKAQREPEILAAVRSLGQEDDADASGAKSTGGAKGGERGAKGTAGEASEPGRASPAFEASRIGVDVCSPGEVAHALALGWLPSEISYTGTNVSDADFDAILAAGVHVNVDLVTQLERFGRGRARGGGGATR